MIGGNSTDEDVVLKLSVVLLCFLTLLWIFVLLLFFWLRKVNQRVNEVCKKWNVYSKLTLNVEQTKTENGTEIKTTSPFPLVLFNKRTKPSEKSQTTLKTWKSIKRDFAYARTDPDENDNQSCLEGTAADDEDRKSFDCSNMQEETLDEDSEDAPPASGIKIDNDGPTLLFLTGGNTDGRRNFLTLKGEEENEEAIEESVQVQTKRLVLVEAEHFFYEDETTFLPNGTITRKCLPKGKVEVPQEPNKEKPAPENDEVKNDADGRVPEKEEKENRAGTSGISEKDSVPRFEDEAEYCIPECKPKEENDASGVTHGHELPARDEKENRASTSGVSVKDNMPRHEDEAEYCMPTECKPKEKRKQKLKPSGRKSKGKHRAIGERVTPVKILNEGKQEDRNAQHSADKQTEDHNGDKPRINVPINRRHASGAAARRSGVQSKHDDGDRGRRDCMATQGHGHVTSGSKEMAAQDTSEEIYCNIDDNKVGARETSTGAHAQTMYVNFNISEQVDEQFLDDSLIYSNVDDVVGQESTHMLYDNPGFDNADEGPIYVNLKEMFDI